MKVQFLALAATIALPLISSGCTSQGGALPMGACNPAGSGVLYAIPNDYGQIDMSRYSATNCRKYP